MRTRSEVELIELLLRIRISIKDKPSDFKALVYNKILFKLKYLKRNINHKTDEELAVALIELVQKFYNLPKGFETLKNRKRTIVMPRQIIMTLLRLNTKFSLEYIGGICGGKNHATVLHAHKTVDSLYDTDIRFRSDFEQIKHNLGLKYEKYKTFKRNTYNTGLVYNH